MSINLQIDTLMLDGIDIQPHQTRELKEAVETVLKQHLAAQAGVSALRFQDSHQPVAAGFISINSSQSVTSVGEQIGNSVYWGIRK